MTAQELFNKVVEHLARQKEPATTATTNRCTLLNEKGQMCAVGCLIPKEDYHVSMEESSGIRVDMPYQTAVDVGNTMMQWLLTKHPQHILLLDRLQNVHDYNSEESKGETWGHSLKEVAVEWKLTFSQEAFETYLADPTYCYPA